MILDQQTRQILDILIAAAPDLPRKSYSYQHICKLINREEDDMFPLVKMLVEKGLAEYSYAASKSARRDVGIALTHKGTVYKELQALERKERWKERAYGFFSGVAVTVLAGLILQSIFGQ